MTDAIPHQLLKRTSTFLQCPSFDGISPPPPLIQVTLSSDPPVPGKKDKFTISGKISEDLTASASILIAFMDTAKNLLGKPFVVPVCTGKHCLIKANEPFKKSVEVPILAKLPNPYILLVAVGYVPLIFKA
ncbi:9179_t:CDS:1, partial [Funneliformis geosporum]